MLGGLARNSFVSPNHLIELKWDGLRALGGPWIRMRLAQSYPGGNGENG